jgi:DNA replication and repair protein RecF
MHLARLRLRDFRNYPRLDAEFGPGFHLLLGDNAQGKTNLLEAVYLLATLRSFRGVGGQPMIRQGAKGYFVGATVVGAGEHEIKTYWSLRERQLTLDGQPVRRLADYLGTLRTVVFCTEDWQLIKGPARARRRYLDLLLAQTQPGYLDLLQRYARALRSRNALLKQPSVDEAALDSFTQELITRGNSLTQHRRALAPQLAELVRTAAARVAVGAEEVRLVYQPSVKEDFAVQLAQSRARERAWRLTLIGPHRDDVQLLLDDHAAAQFASEGQQRTLALALKLAQAELLTQVHGAPPVLLVDDVMGELDRQRRGAFLPLLERVHEARGQAWLTATAEDWPALPGGPRHRWRIQAGSLAPEP